MNTDHYTYRLTWSADDQEHVGLCAELPSLSWMDATPEAALAGIRRLVAEVVADMAERREAVPAPVTQRHGRGLKQAPN